jgi:hypothetical protein
MRTAPHEALGGEQRVLNEIALCATAPMRTVPGRFPRLPARRDPIAYLTDLPLELRMAPSATHASAVWTW